MNITPSGADRDSLVAPERSGDTFVDDYLDELLGDTRVDAAPAPVPVPDPLPAPVVPAADAVADVPVPAPQASPAPALPSAAPMPAVPVEPPRAALIQATRWLRVAVDADSYAIELLRVQEVVRVAPIVRMRGAARAVLGVMNLRGRIVPVFDLGLWLGAGVVSPTDRSRVVVIERADELIGVLVTAVDDVVTLGRERIEPPMVTGISSTMTDAILGIARVGTTPTVLLDANALFG